MTSEDLVPAGLRRLWGLSETSKLGRRAELDVRQVVNKAIELADRDGLAGVTLPKVAKELGFTSMSLYRYVGSKDELLLLMQDAALGVPSEPAAGETSWRERLFHWTFEQWRLYQRRPWLVRIPQSGPPSGPNQLAWMDAALGVLRETGLGWARKVGVLMVLSGHVRNSALQSQELAAGLDEGADQAAAERAYGQALVKLVDPARLPEVAALFTSGLFETPTPDNAGPSIADSDFVLGSS